MEDLQARLKNTGIERQESCTVRHPVHALGVKQVTPEKTKQEPRECRDAIETDIRKYERLYRKYASLFDLAPIGYLVVDQDGLIHELNLATTISLNAPRSTLTGRLFTDFIHHDDLETFKIHQLICQRNLEAVLFELKMKKADGFFFDAQLQMQPMVTPYGDEPQYSIALVDISEHVQLSTSYSLQQNCLELAHRAAGMDELLRSCVHLIRSYLKCDAVGIRISDEAGNIPYQAYDGFSRAFYECESRQCLHTDQCMCMALIKAKADAKLSFLTKNGSYYANGASRLLATVPANGSGATRYACQANGYESIAMVPIYIDDTIEGLIQVADRREYRFPLRVVETLENVASRLGLAIQRFFLQEKLRESLDKLNDLSRHLMTVQEDEQRRIAMELHDSCGQDLNVLKLRLKDIQKRLPVDATDLIRSCDQLLTYSDKIINDIRNIAHGMMPAELNVLGLTAGSKRMIREFTTHSNIQIDTDIDLLACITDPMDQVCLFRIFQEALTNIHKHAQATQVTIAAERDGNTIRIRIQDNGVGFGSLHRSDQNDGGKGMGLSTLELRCRMIGAQLSTESEEGKGTRLTICLPLSEKLRR